MKSGPIKWHGGKSYLAPKIRALFPKHTRYVETHFGGGAVLLAGNGEGVAEFANDINWELYAFWTTLARPEHFEQFKRIVDAAPLGELAFDDAVNYLSRDLETSERHNVAAAFFIRNRQSRQALGRNYVTPTKRLRRGMNEQVSAWLSAVDGLPEFHKRLRRVEIRRGDPLDIIRELDSADTLFYCDPRSSTGKYAHEMGVDQHAALLNVLRGTEGKFLLSGYRSAMYDAMAERYKWRRVDMEIPNQASSKRMKEIKTECLWMNFPGASA